MSLSNIRTFSVLVAETWHYRSYRKLTTQKGSVQKSHIRYVYGD
jgi:hypothetical protein